MRRVVLLLLASSAVADEEERRIDEAIADIADGRRVAAGRKTLEAQSDRSLVVRKLSDAVESDDYGVLAKTRLLTTLGLDQPSAARSALDSKSVSAQRAACTLLWGDPESKARSAEIALAWLRDVAADDRGQAASICGHLEIAEARPVLLEIAVKAPKGEEARKLFAGALRALGDTKPPDVVERLFTLASDPAMDGDVRGVALESLQQMKDGPRDRVLELSIGLVANEGADRILRMKAALGLRRFPEDRACQALEAVLLSEKEQDRIFQRNCLYALGQMDPLDPAVARRYVDRLRQLLCDRRVYTNPYFAIRVDVATALSAMNARDPITLDIMCDYLVNEDKDDKEHLVRQEAWLTLWALTGTRLPALPEPELFETPPQAFPDPSAARDYFFLRAHHRPGITFRQSAVVAKIAGDLERMRRTRKIYRERREEILARWKAEAVATPPPEPPEDPEPQGPAKPK